MEGRVPEVARGLGMVEVLRVLETELFNACPGFLDAGDGGLLAGLKSSSNNWLLTLFPLDRLL